MTEAAQKALDTLLEGNRRFVDERNHHRKYTGGHLEKLAAGTQPIAAIVACVDSRVVPEVLFDQPLGSMFVSRVPANVASESALWMIDLAVGEFHVPLVMVLGHTGCVAVKQIIEGKSGPGGLLRFKVQAAATQARLKDPPDLYPATIQANAKHSLDELMRDSYLLRDSVRDGTCSAVAAVYDMESGVVSVLD